MCFGFLHLQHLATIFCNPCVFCTHTHAESVWYCCDVQWMWLCYACGPLHTATHFLCPDLRKCPNHHRRLVIVCTQPCRCDLLVWGSVSHEQECAASKQLRNMANKLYTHAHMHDQTSRYMHLPPAYQGRQRDWLVPDLSLAGHLCIWFARFTTCMFIFVGQCVSVYEGAHAGVGMSQKGYCKAVHVQTCVHEQLEPHQTWFDVWYSLLDT